MRENEYKEILSALLGLLNEGVHIVAGQGTSIFTIPLWPGWNRWSRQMWSAGVLRMRFLTWIWSPVRFTVRSRPGHPQVNQPQRYINASGKYIHTINTTIPVKDADGKLLAVIEVANDVTQLSELCDRLAHLQSQVGTQETSKNRSSNAITFPIGSGVIPSSRRAWSGPSGRRKTTCRC